MRARRVLKQCDRKVLLWLQVRECSRTLNTPPTTLSLQSARGTAWKQNTKQKHYSILKFLYMFYFHCKSSVLPVRSSPAGPELWCWSQLPGYHWLWPPDPALLWIWGINNNKTLSKTKKSLIGAVDKGRGELESAINEKCHRLNGCEPWNDGTILRSLVLPVVCLAPLCKVFPPA